MYEPLIRAVGVGSPRVPTLSMAGRREGERVAVLRGHDAHASRQEPQCKRCTKLIGKRGLVSSVCGGLLRCLAFKQSRPRVLVESERAAQCGQFDISEQGRSGIASRSNSPMPITSGSGGRRGAALLACRWCTPGPSPPTARWRRCTTSCATTSGAGVEQPQRGGAARAYPPGDGHAFTPAVRCRPACRRRRARAGDRQGDADREQRRRHRRHRPRRLELGSPRGRLYFPPLSGGRRHAASAPALPGWQRRHRSHQMASSNFTAGSSAASATQPTTGSV